MALRRHNLTAPHRETKFTIDDLVIYDREDNEITVNVEFEYDWEHREIINLTLTDTTTQQTVSLDYRLFYASQIDNLYHELHEHVANRTEEPNF